MSIATFKKSWKFSDVGQKTIGTFDKLFDRVVKTAFQVYMGTSWAEKLSDENLTFSCSDIERNVFTFVRKFLNWVVRTAFYLAIRLFWEEVYSLSFSPIFFGHSAKNLRDFVECLSTGLSKLHSSCPEAFFALNIFCKKVVEFCLSLSDFQTKIFFCGRKKTPFVKMHSNSPLEQFEKKVTFGSFFGHF